MTGLFSTLPFAIRQIVISLIDGILAWEQLALFYPVTLANMLRLSPHPPPCWPFLSFNLIHSPMGVEMLQSEINLKVYLTRLKSRINSPKVGLTPPKSD